MVVAGPSLDEQAAANRTRSETPGQTSPARRIWDFNFKGFHPKSLESWAVVNHTYDLLLVADGMQVV